MFTPACKGESNTVATLTDPAGDSPVFNIAGAAVGILNDDTFPLYLDF